MNNRIKLFSLSALALGAIAHASIIITGIYDGDNSDPKGIELYVTSTGNYSAWSVKAQFNAATAWSGAYDFSDLANANFSAGDFIYITSTNTTLTNWGWSSKGTIISNSTFNANGNDRFGVFDGTSTLVDIYGAAGVDGTGENWEYTDSYAYRVSKTGPSSSFVESEWTFGGINFLDSVTGGQQTFLTNTFGTYAVPEPSAYAALLGALAIGFVAVRRRRR